MKCESYKEVLLALFASPKVILLTGRTKFQISLNIMQFFSIKKLICYSLFKKLRNQFSNIVALISPWL